MYGNDNNGGDNGDDHDLSADTVTHRYSPWSVPGMGDEVLWSHKSQPISPSNARKRDP